MSDTPEVNECPKCKAPFWYFTSVNTRVYECGSENFQIQSKACKYATRLREELNAANAKIQRLVEAGDVLLMWLGEDIYPSDGQRLQDQWTKAKEGL